MAEFEIDKESIFDALRYVSDLHLGKVTIKLIRPERDITEDEISTRRVNYLEEKLEKLSKETSGGKELENQVVILKK